VNRNNSRDTTQELQHSVYKITGGNFKRRESFKDRKYAMQCKVGEEFFFFNR
jgi:hypothetical protein